MTVAFSSKEGLSVFRRADGSFSWIGKYKGVSVKNALPIAGGKKCILLLDPDASNRSTFENLLCIEQSGRTIWTAKLPSNPDAFLETSLTSEGISALTWSGLRVVLDPYTGVEKKRIFVK